MTLPKQIIYPIRYFSLLSRPDDGAEEDFSAKLSTFLGGQIYVYPIGRARAGLYLLTKLAVRGRKRRVILSPYTIPDVVNMIKFAGGEPVFVDCLRCSTNLNFNQLANLIDKTVCCVIVTHYHLNQNMAEIRAICASNEVMLVDDCALALGGSEPTGRIGSTTDASVFSFSGFKALNYFWGGAITTRSVEIAQRLSKEIGQWDRLGRKQYCSQVLKVLKYDVATRTSIFSNLIFPYFRRMALRGGDKEILPLVRIESTEIDKTILSRPSEGACKELARKLGSVQDLVRHRRSIAAIYECQLGEFLIGTETSLELRAGSSWVNYPICVDPIYRTKIYKKILAQGIDVGLSLYPNVHEMEGFTNIAGHSENVRTLVRSMIYLPTHPRISKEYATRLADVVASSVRTS